MNITDIRVKKISAPGKMRAIASITFDDMFVVHDIKVIEGQSGLFIAMPSKKTPSGEYKDVAHPINSRRARAFKCRYWKPMKTCPKNSSRKRRMQKH